MLKTSTPPDSGRLYFEGAEFVDNETGPVWHGFFGRQGGVSENVYASLNCGAGSDDDPAHVIENKRIVCEQAGIDPGRLVTLHQVHSPICVEVHEPWNLDKRPQADALVTTQPGLAIGVLTADCAPVLFYGENNEGPVVGAAHAGWGGALKGVLEATVQMMQERGAEEIRACIGPCIGKASYEVREAFSAPFLEEDDANEHFFQAGQRSGHLMFDLPGYCARKLSLAGLKKVSIKDLDTFFNEEDFFSYRRATHRQEADYGRQISVIMIKEA